LVYFCKQIGQDFLITKSAHYNNYNEFITNYDKLQQDLSIGFDVPLIN